MVIANAKWNQKPGAKRAEEGRAFGGAGALQFEFECGLRSCDLEHRDLTSLQRRVSGYEVEAPSRGHCKPLLLLSLSVLLSVVVVVVVIVFLDILIVLVVANIVDGWRTKNQEKH